MDILNALIDLRVFGSLIFLLTIFAISYQIAKKAVHWKWTAQIDGLDIRDERRPGESNEEVEKRLREENTLPFAGAITGLIIVLLIPLFI
tara:strand:- start:1206 stop:1475 length:270 start_codon:yes stop_codon:yes gene_type:complete